MSTCPTGARKPDSDAPLVPGASEDDSDVGWGESRPAKEFSDEWYEEQRPPHWS